jgi:glycosyltransferase involved in cell wall biosynthesis
MAAANVPDRLHFLFATGHAFLPQRADGSERSTDALCRALAARGHQVTLYCRLRPDDALGRALRARAKLLRSGDLVSDHLLGYRALRRKWGAAEDVAPVLAACAPDLVVVDGTGRMPLVRSFLAAGLPTMLLLRDVEFDELGGPPPSDPRLVLLANSRFTSQRCREVFGLEAAVIPPIVEPDVYRCTPGSGGFVTFVNPVPRKGVDVACALAEACPEIPFLFVEGWPQPAAERAPWRRRARAAGNVAWQRRVRDMRRIYKRTRVLLAPSRWEEGWGRVVSEAQASGIPVLASDRGALPATVGPGGCCLDPDGPLERWSETLRSWWHDPARHRRVSRAALEHAGRSEAQPDAIVAAFLHEVSGHLSRRWPVPPGQTGALPACPEAP